MTQTVKDRRHKDHALRRQQRAQAGMGNLQPLFRPKAGSDERFKEMKIGLFYDQSKTRRHVFATAGHHERFGELLRGHADALELEQAYETLSLTDGGPWIRNQLLKRLKKLKAMLLDFYHLSEHVWNTAKACWGDSAEGKTWASKQLHDIKHLGGLAVLPAIDEAKKKLRASAKQETARLLRNYIVERWEMVDCLTALAKSWDIGSGPAEAMCKNLTLRPKRPRMKWDTDNAAALMDLVAVRESGQWTPYFDYCVSKEALPLLETLVFERPEACDRFFGFARINSKLEKSPDAKFLGQTRFGIRCREVFAKPRLRV